MPATLDDHARALLDGRNFATVATLDPDGSPHSSVVWFLRDGDDVLFSSTARRRKVRNIERDPRVALSVYDLADPYASVDIRGTATIAVDEGKRLPVELSHKYLGEDPPPEPDDEVRYVVRITPDKVTSFRA